MQVYRLLSEEPGFLGVHAEGGPWTFLSLLSATEYRPQEVREGRPSQEEQDRAQNSLEYFACCQPLGPYLVAKD